MNIITNFKRISLNLFKSNALNYYIYTVFFIYIKKYNQKILFQIKIKI